MLGEAAIGQVMLAKAAIDATPAGTVPPRLIPSL